MNKELDSLHYKLYKVYNHHFYFILYEQVHFHHYKIINARKEKCNRCSKDINLEKKNFKNLREKTINYFDNFLYFS